MVLATHSEVELDSWPKTKKLNLILDQKKWSWTWLEPKENKMNLKLETYWPKKKKKLESWKVIATPDYQKKKKGDGNPHKKKKNESWNVPIFWVWVDWHCEISEAMQVRKQEAHTQGEGTIDSKKVWPRQYGCAALFSMRLKNETPRLAPVPVFSTPNCHFVTALGGEHLTHYPPPPPTLYSLRYTIPTLYYTSSIYINSE